MNKQILIGRIGSAINQHTTKTQNFMISFSLATNERVNNEDVTTWHNCKCFGKTAEMIERYFAKGDVISLEGKLTKSKYTNDKGVNHESVETIVEKFHFIPTNRKPKNETEQ